MAMYGSQEWMAGLGYNNIGNYYKPAATAQPNYYDQLQERMRAEEAARKAALAQAQKLQQAQQQRMLENQSIQQNMERARLAERQRVLGQTAAPQTMWEKLQSMFSNPNAQPSMYTSWNSPTQNPWATVDPSTVRPGYQDPKETYYNTLYGQKVQGFLARNTPNAWTPDGRWDQEHTYYNGLLDDEKFHSPFVPALAENPAQPPPNYGNGGYVPPTYSFGGGGRRSSGGYAPSRDINKWYQSMVQWNINRPESG